MLSVSPGDDAVDVEGDVVVTVVFSEPMDPATIDATTVALAGPAGDVAGTLTYDQVQATASFRSTDELIALERYTLTIAAEVADLAGNPMDAPFTATFTVAERWWHRPAPIHLAAATGFPEVACDDAGDVVMVWLQAGVDRYDLYATRRIGDAWDAPQMLDSHDRNPVITFDLDNNASGDAIVMWDQGLDVWVRHYRPESGWDDAVGLDPLTSAGRVVLNDAGDALMLGEDINALMAVRYPAADGYEAATTISDGNVGGAAFDLSDAGEAMVIWSESDGFDYYPWAMAYTVGQGWGTAGPIGTDAGFPIGVEIAPSGEAVAAWREHGVSYDIVARRHVPDEGWSTSTTLRSDPEDAPTPDTVLASDAQGNAIVIWGEREPYRVVARRFDVATGTWGAPTTSPTEDVANGTELQFDAAGTAFVVWHERRTASGDRTIVAARYVDGGLVTADVEELGNSEPHASLATCPGGEAIVVWVEEDEGIYASEYR